MKKFKKIGIISILAIGILFCYNIKKTYAITGITHLFHFDEGTGATTKDEIIGNYINFPFTWTAGKYGAGAKQYYTDNWLEINLSNYFNNDSFTIQFWYNNTSNNSRPKIKLVEDDLNWSHVEFYTAKTTIYNLDPDIITGDYYGATWPQDTNWHLATYIYNKTGGYIEIWQDETRVISWEIDAGTNPLEYKKLLVKGDNGYNLMDELVVYNRAITQQEVEEIYDNGEGTQLTTISPPTSLYWLGIGSQYIPIGQTITIPVRYNVCNIWEELGDEPIAIRINGSGIYSYPQYLKYEGIGIENCQGDINLSVKGIGSPLTNEYAKIELFNLDMGVFYDSSGFLYSTGYDPTWQENGILLANMPYHTQINNLYPSTTTIEYQFDFTEMGNISTSTHKIALYNNQTAGITEFYSTDFNNTEADFGTITITNGTFGEYYDLALVLIENTSPSTILLKSNTFKISYGTTATNPENWEIGGEAGTSTSWITDNIVERGNWLINLLNNVFPFNIALQFKNTWYNSNNDDLPNTLNLLNITENNNIYVYLPKKWGGGENEEMLIWGEDIFYATQTSENICNFIKNMSTYFMWFMFFIGVYWQGKQIYNELNE